MVLKKEGLGPDCWATVVDLKMACIYDVVLFFLNGHIGSKCCQSIATIGHKCFPSMVASLDGLHGCCGVQQVTGPLQDAITPATSDGATAGCNVRRVSGFPLVASWHL
ncbi:hypothetical protein L484_000049 [Morus notabilis]|uniref:Prolamin-like domain-containing protein n=1 Tax=Morus notabilis TaxID=981085 RepID=W9SQ02_9ROSA|nr:hypothetical protein L484_016521 [Morus notabilis]EXC54845.1 hypothetical protein L484_000049 [Morus notabilis]